MWRQAAWARIRHNEAAHASLGNGQSLHWLLRTANHSTSTESASPWAGHGVPEGIELLAYLLALTRR